MAACLATNDIPWFFFFYTFWGYCSALITLILRIKAVKHFEYQWWAAMGLQATLSINLCMCPAFWYFYGPSIIKMKCKTDMDVFTKLHMTTLHSLPIVGGLIDVLL